MTGRIDAARVRDTLRISDMQQRLLRHEVLLEAVLIRVREALVRGSKEQLEQLEDDLVTAIAAGPPPLPPGADTISQEEDAIREAHRRYRIFLEELATKGIEMGGTGAALRARELLGWPRETRIR